MKELYEDKEVIADMNRQMEEALENITTGTLAHHRGKFQALHVGSVSMSAYYGKCVLLTMDSMRTADGDQVEIAVPLVAVPKLLAAIKNRAKSLEDAPVFGDIIG